MTKEIEIKWRTYKISISKFLGIYMKWKSIGLKFRIGIFLEAKLSSSDQKKKKKKKLSYL